MVEVPGLFRDHGFSVWTIEDVFGRRKVEDEEWLQFAGERQMLAVCKDDNIRFNYHEWQTIHRTAARVLCLGNQAISITLMVQRFRGAIPKIPDLMRAEGPWVFGVHHGGRVERLNLRTVPRRPPEV